MDGRLGNQFFRYAFAQQLKKYNRNKKIALITNSNPTYKDLYEEMTKD